ncbi:TIGR04282 family arsenosugar biosynthesis glycosyltransferase [Oceaniserpentilla sp. 4NH20-0058]|uniref:TIGR04282 family arsenosugar biosynthesis glycosyltransferase n=1 Tax=Oceaniserpentilla sp. 4NH20-0058 TaxID=3127660 RepID=UPI00310C647B
MFEHVLIQFAKFPQLGNVKTRLSPVLGDEGCLHLHCDLVVHTHTLLIQAAAKLGGLTVLSLGQLGDNTLINRLGKLTPVLLQHGDDLGEKMANAINWGLTIAKKVIIVGSDCPALTITDIAQALDALNEQANVFINAEDGGYVLVGATKNSDDLFVGVPWGTEDVMHVTLQRLQAAHKKAVILGPLWDVDCEEDYQRLLTQFPNWPDTSA